ncbi:hypothetical protein DAEQUDRAFT_503718 [Daedalea quercina L-15889]|uniref:Uncharacterized protein n=1 Tax=Daedalea quercina L-15889 TaxID=1314783 RepID=A0A165T7D6_9APHY|nr:hypothetical protein DAEQUDRAFT_503718 [Daedalea quercina L-15889]
MLTSGVSRYPARLYGLIGLVGSISKSAASNCLVIAMQIRATQLSYSRLHQDCDWWHSVPINLCACACDHSVSRCLMFIEHGMQGRRCKCEVRRHRVIA